VSIDEVTTRIAPVSVSTETSASRSGGWLRMSRKTRIANRMPSPAMLPKVIVQLVACSRAARGISAISCPVCPTMPVNCTMTGERWAGNQVATRRRAPGKIAASPAPSSTRASRATPTLGETAMTSWPSAMSTMPMVMMGRAP
jgi:hypothetical protein